MESQDIDAALRRLAAPYFQQTCRQVLDGYLAEEGFRCAREDYHTVVYDKNDCRLEFSHWPEDAPNYHVMVGLGLMDRLSHECPVFEHIGLWYAMPENEPGTDYPFTNPIELESALGSIREHLNRYGKPLWDDRARLQSLVDKQSMEVQAEERSEAAGEIIQQARAAFTSGQYEDALQIYERVDSGALCKSDAKKISIAKSRCRKT